jgi:hypothetical protein
MVRRPLSVEIAGSIDSVVREFDKLNHPAKAQTPIVEDARNDKYRESPLPHPRPHIGSQPADQQLGIAARVLELTGGTGSDVAFECAGVAPS